MLRSLVPSIATEFVRNRELHDRTARQWTALYAQPKAPTPPTATLSTKQKGKKKALQQAISTESASSRVPAATVGGAIIIEESDDEEVRVLEANMNARKRRRTAAGVNLHLDDDVGEIASGSKKQLVKAGEDDSSTRGKKAKRPRLSQPTAEVIVIDD